MKIISFSVWGTDPNYVAGALANIKLAALYYPGWKCRIYCGLDVPDDQTAALATAGFDVHWGFARTLHAGLFWRFLPAYEVGVEAFLSRDCDSRLNPREAAAVNEWLASGKRLHTMRDHYQHIVPILGGMWGCRHWPEFKLLLEKWKRTRSTGKMGDDQDFLKEMIWPMVKDDDCIQHDRYTIDTVVDTPNGPFTYKPVEFFGGSNLRPFPPHAPLDEKIHGPFVWSRVSP